MVISRTPLRVSFVGGGSDLPEFATEHGGAVLSTTIDKYVYVVVTERFEPDIRVSYSRTEITPTIDKLEHELIREALRVAGIPRKIEIVTIADVPARGTGLGSSSAVTVGTLNALFAYQGILKSAAELAADAARIEIETLGKPIGKQDQYACAFGGFQLIRFGPGEAVRRDPLVLSEPQRRQLERSLLAFYTGRQRSAAAVLHDVRASVLDRPEARENLLRMRDLALALYESLSRGDDPDELGRFLHENWLLKRALDKGVSTSRIDRWYRRALGAGALGGKLLGAGGGGFLLIYAPPATQDAVRAALSDLREMPLRVEPEGSRIIHIGR
jgi:D-glycero-alpha-D-manno-heptose-7-phosphate kinase